MPFGDYKTLGDAIRDLQVKELREDFVQLRPVPVSDHLRFWVTETLTLFPVNCSEAAVCESLIYPVLREAYRPFAKDLVIWSHASLYRDQVLPGVPDYIIAKRSPLSAEIMGLPHVLIVEAKRNDIDAGWGQCLAAMGAVQKLNGPPDRIIYGIVSDGFIWRFGKLHTSTFTRQFQEFSLSRLDELCAVLNHVLELCRQQALLPAEAA